MRWHSDQENRKNHKGQRSYTALKIENPLRSLCLLLKYDQVYQQQRRFLWYMYIAWSVETINCQNMFGNQNWALNWMPMERGITGIIRYLRLSLCNSARVPAINTGILRPKGYSHQAKANTKVKNLFDVRLLSMWTHNWSYRETVHSCRIRIIHTKSITPVNDICTLKRGAA